MEIIEEEYIDEREKCKCNNSDDSMDDVYEECGLTRKEKKILQDELNALIAEAEEAILREQGPTP